MNSPAAPPTPSAAITPGPEEGAIAPDSRGRSVFVHLMLAMAMLLFVGAAALLYRGWLNANEPESLLTLHGDKTLNGVVASVRRYDPRKPDVSQPLVTTFNEQNRFSPRFFVPPGTYVVQLHLDKEELLLDRVTVRSQRGMHCRLGPLEELREQHRQAGGAGEAK